MPQETKAQGPASTASAAAIAPASPAGWKVDTLAADPAATFEALEKAFDFRGDVTLTLRGGETLAGYVFDRTKGCGLAGSSVRILPADGSPRRSVPYDQISHIAFSDRDPAAGKSFETWVKKYVEKKLAGERASIESEPLDA